MTTSIPSFLPCIAKAAFCDSSEIPYNQRRFFSQSIAEFDDPAMQPLRLFFHRLSRAQGALLLIGDSVMQQFYSAIACELEREGVWKHPSRFTNTDEVQYVRVVDESLDGGSNNNSSSSNNNNSSSDHKVLIKFLPIYHFVDGR